MVSPLDLGLGFPPPPLRASGVNSSKEFHCRLNNISQKLHPPSRQASFSTLSRRLSGWLWKMQILKIYLQLMQLTIFAKVCAKGLSSKKHWNSCLSLDLLSMRKPLLSLRYVIFTIHVHLITHNHFIPSTLKRNFHFHTKSLMCKINKS